MKWMFRRLNKKMTNMKKILHTIYTSLLLAGLVAFALTSCVDDELVKSGEVVEGVPITVTMNLGGVPATDVTIDTRASGSDHSTVHDLVIFIFHEDGTLENAVTNYREEKSLTVNSYKIVNNNHLYKVTFNTTSGTKKLLAVANVAEGGYWGKVIDLLTVAYLEKYSFDKIKALIVSLGEGFTDGVQPFHITSSSQMFISGWNEGVIFGINGSNGNVREYGQYGDKINNVVVKMNRAMANITFNIAAKPEGAKGTFTPTSYRVYNIPTKSYLINDLQGKTSYSLTDEVAADVTYINTASENIGTAQGNNYTFNFYMPENVQAAGTDISEYNDRDEWNVETSTSGASPENKKWVHAPQNSTFVVISGTYEGYATIYDNNTSVNQPVTANVEYTIHLGDFGNSNDANRNFADFSVMRNNSYTYNVEVRGVDNIIVEVIKKEEKQSGAEGSVYDNGQAQYNYSLDAHYEQVYLEYNLSGIANSLCQGLSDEELDDAIANQLILIIQSEMMSHLPNKRAEISPYQIYADAVRDKSGQEAEEAAKAAKADVLGGDKDVNGNPTKGFDYKWIEFLPQTGKNTISNYPGISSWAMEDLDGNKTDGNKIINQSYYAGADGKTDNGNGDPTKLIDVYDMIVEMGKAIKEIYICKYSTSITTPTFTDSRIEVIENSPDYVARFTAFVNEYYYLRHPLTGAKITSWSKVTNKMPREMIIAMSTKTSDDGNSSYSKIHSYISQLSMETFYNDNATSLNAFGIETYNETPLNDSFKFGSPKNENGLSDSDGRENQKVLINSNYNVNPTWGPPIWNSPDWSDYIIFSLNGWTSSVGTDRSSHKLSGDAYIIQAAYSACMSRNRDLNGNGTIDENEIRWFLPSVNEYIRIGIGAKAISNAAKLFIGDKTTMVKGTSATSSDGYPSAYIKDGSLFYTSSASGKRVYWAIEKGSYGSVGSYYDGSPLPIRCIRNLPASAEGAKTDISSINGVKSDATYKKHDASGSTPIVLEFKDRLVSSLYRQRVQGSLDIHNEDGDANKFYDGIFVAKDFITSYSDGNENKEIVLGDIIGYDGTVNWEIKDEWGWTVDKSYKNNGTMTNPCASYDEGGYDWRVPNLVELSAMNAAGLLVHSGSDAACCTQFSNQAVRYGFAYSTLIYCLGANVDQISTNVRIRCVRDVPANYTFPTN